MAKYRALTRVIYDGQDISELVTRVSLDRSYDMVNEVRLTIAIERLAVDEDGALIIHLATPRTT